MGDLCNKCGKCCWARAKDKNGNIVELGYHCMYLTKDNLCSVYNNRPDWCLSAKEMIEQNILPEGCGYIRR